MYLKDISELICTFLQPLFYIFNPQSSSTQTWCGGDCQQQVVNWLLFPGLLTEIQCKSKRLRKNTKASSVGECAGQPAHMGPYPSDNKQVTSTTTLHKASTTSWMGHCGVFYMMG